ncbi:MAG: YfiT family bacillithiol transferase [Gemmatimonadaceae bacterium]
MSPDLRYPIGPFVAPPTADSATRATAIAALAAAPHELRAAVTGLTREQLETPYRPSGWTVRQVVHHVVDSHLNAYTRLRLALTEERPTIRPYDESLWAELVDARSMDVEVSLTLLEALHSRFVTLLSSLADSDWQRRYVHPESGDHTVDYLLEMYAWHGRHHLAHVTALRTRMDWT